MRKLPPAEWFVQGIIEFKGADSEALKIGLPEASITMRDELHEQTVRALVASNHALARSNSLDNYSKLLSGK